MVPAIFPVKCRICGSQAHHTQTDVGKSLLTSAAGLLYTMATGGFWVPSQEGTEVCSSCGANWEQSAGRGWFAALLNTLFVIVLVLAIFRALA